MPQPPGRYLADRQASTLIGPDHTPYAGDLFSETDRYAHLALAVAKSETFDLVHAHDWMTFEAATAVAAASGKPLVLQIHSTELDRREATPTPASWNGNAPECSRPIASSP